MIATVRHVTAWAGRTKFQTDGFLFVGVYHLNGFHRNIQFTPWRWRKMTTILFLTSTSIGDRWQSGRWGLLKAYPRKPIPELQITLPSSQQACHSCYLGAQGLGFVQQRNPPWWIGGPPLRKVGTAKDRYNVPSFCQWGQLSPLKSPLYLRSCHMSRWHISILAECQLKTSSCLLACHSGSSPVPSILLRMMWD